MFEESKTSVIDMKTKARVIALYLPQFHPFKENDEWWGKGFTEWTNVGRAKPLFKGHYQPRVPADLGYYDLRLPCVREEQAQLAREAGIEGFCYWHYWFGNGKQLMAEIIDEVIATGKPDFPFMLGWANHSWYAKNWNTNDTNGKDRLLIEQKYLGDEDLRMHYEYALKAFKDKRYIKDGNKPLFMIYNAKETPTNMIPLWNKWAKEDGFDGVYFLGNIKMNDSINHYISNGFSSVIINRLDTKNFVNRSFLKRAIKKVIFYLTSLPTFEYKDVFDKFLDQNIESNENVIPSIIPGYDHSPRSGKYGLILHNTTPEYFYKHCKDVLNTIKNKKNKFILLRSWNEWGEGNYMEPDLKYGKSFINMLRKAIDDI